MTEVATGNERLNVTSGAAVVLDQYMPANLQLTAGLAGAGIGGVSAAVERFGGFVLTLAQGTYTVFREPRERLMAVHPQCDPPPVTPEGEELGTNLSSERIHAEGRLIGSVCVETNCLVFADADLLLDTALLARYRELCASAQWKQARDLLREKGAAVRYGFHRNGHELNVYALAARSGFFFTEKRREPRAPFGKTEDARAE